MKRSMPGSLVAVGGAAALALAAIAAAQPGSPGPDPREEVAGWAIDEVADPTEYEPDRRSARMTRRIGGDSLDYQLYPETYWADGYDVRINGCFGSRGIDVPGEMTLAERASRTRAAIAAEIDGLRRVCDLPAGAGQALLEGFEAAFPALAARRERLLAERAAQEERYIAQNMIEMDAAEAAAGGAMEAANNAMLCEMPDC
jgi:hypothetical protein